MEFEGHITAEFKFNVINVFRCHFRMHNIVVLSFRKDMIIVQTMTNPYRMPNVGTKGLYTTMIPLSSMKAYEFDCNHAEVNVMVSKILVVGSFKSRCINVVRTEPLGADNKSSVEVTFDWLHKDRNVEICTKVSDSFGFHSSEPYPHFLVNSPLDYRIQEDYVRKLMGALGTRAEPKSPNEIQSVLVDNPSAFKSFYSPNYRIFIKKDCIVMDDCNGAFNTTLGIGLVDNNLEFEVPSKPFKNLFKFMGSCKSEFEIVKSILPEFIIRDKYHSTYVYFNRS